MRDYPLLDLFWTMLYFFFWIVWIFLLLRIITDIFRSPDLSGWARAGWTAMLVLLPFIGVLAYLIFRGSDMHTREGRRVGSTDDMFYRSAHPVGGSAPSKADELHKLAALRDRRVLTEDEFTAEKAKLLSWHA